MNQSYQVGPARSIKVYPGDKVDAEVYAYYESASGYGTTSPATSVIMSAVATAFGGVSGGSGESGKIYSAVSDAFAATGLAGNQGDDQPAAYLNYILFDKNYNFLDMGWQAVTEASSWAKAKVEFEETIDVKEEGYVYIYLSYENQSNNYVYFDDLKVTHTKSNVIQYSEYYPFGLQSSTSWTRENTKDNNYLYNAANELNKTTGWYEMFYRGYDPAIGRMLQVDPYAPLYASYTTYNYAINNPVMMNDPSGGQTDATGLSDYQLRSLYRVHGRGEYSSYDDWANSEVTGSSLEGSYYGGGGTPTVYNRWCGCTVSALEVLAHDPTNQNKGFRAEAQAAVDKYYSEMNDPYKDIEVLYTSFRVDILRETVRISNSFFKSSKINTVYIQFDKKGKISDIVSTQKNAITFDPENNSGETEYYGSLGLSAAMQDFISIAENSVFHCFGCHEDRSASQQYRDFILSPQDEKRKNRNVVISSQHR